MGIFDIHHLIADVVGSLYQINQWMAGIFQWRAVQLPHAQFLCNPTETLFFGSKETEFGLLARQA